MSKIIKSESEWQEELPAEVFEVCRNCGTEPPFSGRYYNFWESGTYHCACCDAILFSSEHKYDSGSGWPSFFQPHAQAQLALLEDRSHGMVRTEVRCEACDAHLGHVFEDGPPPSGLRYCINSVSMVFKPAET